MKVCRATVLLLLLTTGIIHAQSSSGRPDALVLYRKGLYREAEKVTRLELKENPKSMNAYTVLGWSLLALGKYAQAVQESLRALQISPYDNRIVQIVGEGYHRMGKDKKAERYFKEYILLTPTGRLIDEVYYMLGEIYVSRKEYKKADIVFSAATYFNPDNAMWWYSLGKARELEKEYKLALQAYKQAAEMSSGSIEIDKGIQRMRKIIEMQ